MNSSGNQTETSRQLVFIIWMSRTRSQLRTGGRLVLSGASWKGKRTVICVRYARISQVHLITNPEEQMQMAQGAQKLVLSLEGTNFSCSAPVNGNQT